MTPTLAPPPPVVTDINQLDPNGSYTYADYLSWKFNEIVELIRGRVFRKMAGPLTAHQIISSNLHRDIAGFLKRKSCRAFHAPTDVRLLRSPEKGDAQIRTVVQPDIFVVCDPVRLDERGCLGAPDWIIEIVSPRTARLDTGTKYDLYAENGVREYWIVFPKEKTVLAYALNERNEYELKAEYDEPGRLVSLTLPELVLEWADVFEGV